MFGLRSNNVKAKIKKERFLCSGVLPHVPKMLPVLVQDEELRERAIETFTSDEFKNNIEEYFVENIKVIFQKIISLFLLL